MPQEKKDIQNIDDIKLFVDTFYEQIQKDDILGHIFNDRIQDRWPEHLNKMYRFWQTVLLDEHTYYGSPFVPHAYLPVDRVHFERWVQIFEKTINTHFEGSKAEKAKWQGQRMAEMFQVKIQYIRDNDVIPLK